MIDPSKFTDDYIAKTDTETLNGERKALIRQNVAGQEAAARLRGVLADRGEVLKATEDLAAMPEARRRALANAMKNVKTTGSGKVS